LLKRFVDGLRDLLREEGSEFSTTCTTAAFSSLERRCFFGLLRTAWTASADHFAGRPNGQIRAVH
jgi:hypothetical protein